MTFVELGEARECARSDYDRAPCLDHMIFFTENSPRRAITSYVTHFHRERNHQGLGNWVIEPGGGLVDRTDEVCCRERLGGMLRHCYRKAA